MAITQTRLAALITAAKTFQERHTLMIDVMTLLHRMMREGEISPAEAMERLFNQFSDRAVPIEAAGVIEAEWTRYQITHKRNEYMKEYQRRRRAGAGAFRAPSDNASRAPSDEGTANARAPCGAPSGAPSDDAMSLAEIEAAIARVSHTNTTPSSNAAALRAPSSNASAETAPSAAFDAELSADDLL